MKLRLALSIAVSACCLQAQFKWKCDPKDGKFVTTLCSKCKPIYCWDGQIFSEEEGYEPPPHFVLAYWEEVKRKSAQIRADLARKIEEGKAQSQRAREETARMNQDRAAEHQQFMDDVHRRMRQQGFSPGSMTASTLRPANPKDIVVTALEPAAAATQVSSIVPVSRGKLSSVEVGMNRAAVEQILGKPSSAISIPEENGLVETLTYTVEDHATARVRIEEGKVVWVKISD